MIAWSEREKAILARLNAASIERSFVPARDISWTGSTSREEWLALYRAWSLFPGSRFEAEFTDGTRADFARYQQANLMLTTAMLERYALPMLEDLLRLNQDPEFVEYVGHFIKEETYHYVMFMRAVGKLEAEMPALPPLPKARTERILKATFQLLRLVPGQRLRAAVSFTVFHYAEQVSVHAYGVAKEAAPRRDCFVAQVWALHAIDEGRHLQFDRLLLDKLALSPAMSAAARFIALPLCVMGGIAVHLNEAWAARQLGVSARFRHLVGLLRAPTAPFKQRVVGLLRDVIRRPGGAA
jgi:rubrerythrin